MAAGETRKSIAVLLEMSQRGVGKALARARRRCNANSTAHLVADFVSSQIAPYPAGEHAVSIDEEDGRSPAPSPAANARGEH